jgi:hypothetical protein
VLRWRLRGGDRSRLVRKLSAISREPKQLQLIYDLPATGVYEICTNGGVDWFWPRMGLYTRCHKAEVPDCGPEHSRGANLTSEDLDIKKTGADKEMSVAVMCFSVGATKSSVTKAHGRGTRTFCQLPVSVVVVPPRIIFVHSHANLSHPQRSGVRSRGLQTQNASSPHGCIMILPKWPVAGTVRTTISDIDCHTAAI